MHKPDLLSCHRTTESLPEVCDIAIIGSGYAGATMAHYIQAQTKCSIVMLEARESCSGATGRNGGHLKPDAFFSYQKYAALYGAQEAEVLLQFEQDHVQALKELIETENIDCDFDLTRAMDLFMTESEGDYARKSYQMRKDSGGNVEDIHVIPEEQLATISRMKTKAYFGATYSAGSLHPYKLINALLSKAVGKGMNLQTYTPVHRVTKSQDLWELQTDRGILRAKKTVFATNAYTAKLLTDFSNKIIPVRGTVSQIDLPSNFRPLHNTYGIRWKGSDSDYMICRQDRKVILGGAKSTFLGDPKVWYNNTNDGQLMNQASSKYFDTYFSDHFGASDARCEFVWSGILGYSNDFLPYVGELPSLMDDRSEGYVIAGFHGHGMPRVLLCSKALASLVTGKTTNLSGLPSAYILTEKRLANQENHILRDMTGHLKVVNGEEILASQMDQTMASSKPLVATSRL